MPAGSDTNDNTPDDHHPGCIYMQIVKFQFIKQSSKFVILSEHKRVEGSLHRIDCKDNQNAKIFRLRTSRMC